VAFELVAHGPAADLHSGLYGGMVCNPVQALVQLCASLHTPEGWVNVPGFYDGITSPGAWQQAQLAAFPVDLEAQRLSLGVPAWVTPGGIPPLEASRLMPTLEFNGICGGYQGPGSKTIIPAQASVKITCRLVPGQDPARIQTLLTQALQQRCPAGIRLEVCVSSASAAYGVTPPLPGTPLAHQSSSLLGQAFGAMQEAVSAQLGRPPLFLPEGGSIPIISQIRSILGADSLMLGLMLPQDAIHGPNESLHLDLWMRGIATYAQFFSSLAQRHLVLEQAKGSSA
jgi:acetylornithine deacetylase/succinyl-diaminopimelate desuccinylase-like protein